MGDRQSNLPDGADFPEAAGEWQIRGVQNQACDLQGEMIWFSCPTQTHEVCAVPIAPY